VQFASNLTQGYYADPVYVLWSGPGYPLFLAPFMALGWPWLLVKLLNAFLLFGGLFYFYRTLTFYLSELTALFLHSFLVVPADSAGVSRAADRASRILSDLCVRLLLLPSLPTARENGCRCFSLRSAWAAGADEGLLGYVLLASLLYFLLLSLWSRRQQHRRSAQTFLFALVLCVPYLFYTYASTGKVFYWGNTGGAVCLLDVHPLPGRTSATATDSPDSCGRARN